MRATCPTHLILVFITVLILAKSANYEAPCWAIFSILSFFILRFQSTSEHLVLKYPQSVCFPSRPYDTEAKLQYYIFESLLLYALCRTLSRHSGDLEEYDLLGYNSVSFGDSPIFRKETSPSYFGSKGKSIKKSAELGDKLSLLEISGPTVWLLASQEGLCLLELISLTQLTACFCYLLAWLPSTLNMGEKISSETSDCLRTTLHYNSS
jgi:hypothetical protein